MSILKSIMLFFMLVLSSPLFAETSTVTYSLLNTQNNSTSLPFTDADWSVSGSFTELVTYASFHHAIDWKITDFDLFVYHGTTLVAPFLRSNSIGNYAADFIGGGTTSLDFYAIGTGGGHLVLNFVNPIHSQPIYDPILSGYYQTNTVFKEIANNIGAAVVPEPESYSLLVAGLLGLYLRYLKSRKGVPMLILTEGGFNQIL